MAECESFLDIDDFSCVLVGMKHYNKSLIVSNFTRSTSIRIGTQGYYTFAVFGRNLTHMDEQPTLVRSIDTAINITVGTITTMSATEITG